METGSLAAELTPLWFPQHRAASAARPALLQALFGFLVGRVLPATAAEFLELQPLRGSLAILRGRVVPLLAVSALQGHNFTWHKSSSGAAGVKRLVRSTPMAQVT